MLLLTPTISNILRVIFYLLVIITTILGISAFIENSKTKKINEVSLTNEVTNETMQKRNLAIYKFNMSLFFTMCVMFVRENTGTLLYGFQTSYLRIPNIVFIVMVVLTVFFIICSDQKKSRTQANKWHSTLNSTVSRLFQTSITEKSKWLCRKIKFSCKLT